MQIEGEDLYSVLKLTRDASPEEIKKAFRKLAIEYHPDKNNGDKEREEMFKKIGEAYSILSDPDKKRNYDQFGTINPGQGGNPVDLNEILKSMFGDMMGGGVQMGGGPMGGMNGGFSFMFMDGGDPFANFGGQRKKNEADIVDIDIDICDIYYGNNKRVEFEMLELCDKCKGTGAYDQSQIIACLTCNGQGSITQQIGPFFMQKMTCSSCMGKGNIIKKPCSYCKGEKCVYNKKLFELKIPKGIPNNHEIKMEKKGSYSPSTKQQKDMIFKFKYKIEAPYQLDDMNVVYSLDITIDDLLAGFQKDITLYKDKVSIISDRYFNPTNPIIIKEKGLFNIKKQKQCDLYIKFNVSFTDSDRLSKYSEVLQKILKKTPNPPTQQDIVFNIQTLVS